MNPSEGVEPRIRVLLADDQDMIRQGLRYIIDAQPDMQISRVCSDGETAWSELQKGDTDVALLDIRMPNQTGLEVARQVRDHGLSCKVVLLTTFDHAEYLMEAIRSGAAGFLLKDAPTEQLLHGIRRAFAGEVFYSTTHAQTAIANVYLNDAKTELEPFEFLEPLTDREHEVLQMMANGFRNQEIASQMYVSIGTVKTHVHRILQKMNAEDRTQAVVLAIRHKIVK